MKHFLSFVAVTALLLGFGSCSKGSADFPDNPLPEQPAGDGNETEDPAGDVLHELLLSTNIEVQTRAAFPALDKQIAEGEQIAVWVDRANGTKLYDMHLLTADGDGGLTGESTMYFPLNGDNVNIYALHTNASFSGSEYPTATMTHEVLTDQRTQEAYAMSDLLYATAKNVAQTSEAVPLTFYHLLSKLQVAISVGEGLDSSDIQSVSLGGLKNLANITLDKGAMPNAVDITAAGQTTTINIGADISADFTDAGVNYNDAVIVPQTVPAQTILLSILLTDGNTLVYRLTSDLTFESGKKYLLHMSASLNGIELSTSVSDWKPGDLVTGDTDIIHYEITYTDLSTETVYKKGMGGLIEFNGAGKTVRSIELPDFGKSYLIGRKNISSIELNLDGSGNLRFRSSVNGFIPIGCFAELQAINTIAGALSGSYRQEDDIDMMSEEWTSIGNDSTPFAGVYDGGDYNIERINVQQTSLSYQGLFGYIKGSASEVRNVNIASGMYDCGSDIGAICGYSDGGKIIRCSNYAVVKGSWGGGVVGYNNMGRVENCYNAGSVSFSKVYSGGIVGGSNMGRVENCYNTGPVSNSDSYAYSGGIVGHNYENNSVIACYNSGSVSNTTLAAYSGGIVGRNDASNSVIACYNTGTVSAYSYSGGIVGYNEENSNNSVIACYNIGYVYSGNSSCGGIAGYSRNGNNIISCYWKTGINMPSYGIGYGSGSGVDVLSFEMTFTPDADKYPQWGLGNGEENGWWKNYNGKNNLPKLWWEE